MVKLIVAIKRKKGMTPGQFHSHWRTVHAALIRGTAVCRKYIRKYVQCHTLPQEYEGREPAFDGAAELWFDSVEDKDAFFNDPEYLSRIRPDELNFADLEECRFFTASEEPVLP